MLLKIERDLCLDLSERPLFAIKLILFQSVIGKKNFSKRHLKIFRFSYAFYKEFEFHTIPSVSTCEKKPHTERTPSNSFSRPGRQLSPFTLLSFESYPLLCTQVFHRSRSSRLRVNNLYFFMDCFISSFICNKSMTICY